VRLLLFPSMSFRLQWAILLAGMLIFPYGYSYAQGSQAGECLFQGVGRTDLVGKTEAHPDDSPDAVFSLRIGPRPSGAPIAAIEVRTVAGPRGWWSSTKIRGASFIGLASAKEPSLLLNPHEGPVNLSREEAQDLILYVTDDGQFEDPKRQYLVKIDSADGASFTLPVQNQAVQQPVAPPPAAGAVPVRMTAVLKGISNYDAVGKGKTIAGDDKADGLFVLSVQAQNREITGIEIRSTDGTPSIWDTIPGSRNATIGVAAVDDPVRLLNKRDSSVAIPVRDRADLNLYVADNGSISAGNTHYRVAITFRDGEIAWTPVQTSEPPVSDSRVSESTQGQSKVSFQGSWLGEVPTDAVGQYGGYKPDGKRDALFGLDIEVVPKNFITGIEISNVSGTGTVWGTAGTSPSAWGLAVAYPAAPNALLNKPDGTVRIPIDKRTQFYLYVADPGDLGKTYQDLRIVVHLADGSSYQQMVQRPPGTTSSVVPGIGGTAAPKGLVTCEFRGFIADLVNASAKPGKDGYLDGTFILKLEVDNKKLVSVSIAGADGVVRWSSSPKPPIMLLGVSLYPKIFKLVNEKPGPLNVSLSGKRTLYLYAADNGMLSDPKARLMVTITFADKTQMVAEVIK
jgi:hypothetical protein